MPSNVRKYLKHFSSVDFLKHFTGFSLFSETILLPRPTLILDPVRKISNLNRQLMANKALSRDELRDETILKVQATCPQ